MAGRLFVVAAPSGAGKTSLVQSLAADDQSLVLSVSHTTRPRRGAEQDGVHYHFVDASAFAAMREAGEFLEWATVYGHRYGTSRQTVHDAVNAGRDVVLEIDWQGAAQVRTGWPDPVSIFVLPPSRRALEERLTGRAQDDPEVIAKRTAEAVADLSHHGECGRWPFPGEAFHPDPQNPDAIIPASEVEHRAEYLQEIGNDHPLMAVI